MAFPIVAIAASAGGLEPLLELFGSLPSGGGMAYIVIQHLDPDHESLLAEILGRKTAMPVEQAVDQKALEQDHVYVIPPNASLTVADGRLQVCPRHTGRDRHLPADVLFRSLAGVNGGNSISVVLSGGDSDGALGTQAIKYAGGITFAQEPSSARFPGMPRHAIETGCVDFVRPPAEIAAELSRLPASLLSAGQPGAVETASESVAEPGAANDEASLQRLFRQLKSSHGVDFSRYKRSTLRRRLARRMALRHTDSLADYAALTERDPEEVAALYQDFLIRVTEFFRDPQSFEGLAQRVFPVICESRSPKECIRIWVPGCATGEEVYSIAIALTEYLGERPAAAGIQLFGSDVSEAAIAKARAGLYLDSISPDVSAERLRRFFVKEDHHYRIAKSIRDMCIFARQDVVRDPPFSRLDLVSCRNLLIYLDASAQRRVMHVFHYALRPHGFLMLGPSESVGAANDLFEITDKPHRIFVRRSASPGSTPDLLASRPASAAPERAMESDVIEPAVKLESHTAHRAAERLLLSRYAPSGVLVDDALNVLHFHGDPTPYLAHASGPASLNLNRIARPQLLIELGPAIQEARASGTEARRDLAIDGLPPVTLEVIPLKRLSEEACYLILFVEVNRHRDRRPSPAPTHALSETEKDRQLGLAAREVAAMREYLQRTLEEHEAVKEELKSAHEEVLSSNEEFQSTNEELQTSQEELQSANEELITTNEELRNRNRELGVANAELEKARATAVEAQAYADEIIDTVRDPLAVLDRQLCVVRANEAFYSQLRLTPALVEGFPLCELGNRQFDLAELRDRLVAVLARTEPVNDMEMAYVVPLVGSRVLCVNARRIAPHNERVELILLALEDITERRAGTDTIREGSRRKDEFLAMLAHELRNPLAPLMHTITLLRRAGVDAVTLKRYDLMERQIQRMVRLVDELLDVARISRGLIDLKRETLDLRSTIHQSVEASRARAEHYQHDLTVSLPETPLYVEGDSVRLEQVVSNLIENACKYTLPGGSIAVTLTEGDGEAIISVKDTGIGLAPDMLDRIFDLFTQVDSTLARSGGGLGLGLAVVKRVLDLHGGRIVARSAGLGLGSEFLVRLPLVPVTEEMMRGDRRDDQPASSAVCRRVLIVDDNLDVASSMAALLNAWGHEANVARDGEAALTMAAGWTPDTALVDIGLPGMGGYELARRFRKVPGLEAMRLVAMTGYGSAEDRSASRAAGFDVHLVKPADMDELERLLAAP